MKSNHISNNNTNTDNDNDNFVRQKSLDIPIELSLVTTNHNIQEGKIVLSENEFIRDLIRLTNSELFRSFYTKYFDKRSESTDKIVLLYIHLHYVLEEKYAQTSNGNDLSDEMKAFILSRVMSDPKLVREIVSIFTSRGELPRKTEK